MAFLKAESTPLPAMQGWVSAGPIFLVNDGDENHQFSVFDFFDSFSAKTLKCPLFPLLRPFGAFRCPPPSSGSRLGDGWERSGRRLGDGWEGFGKRLGDVREPSGRGLGDVWETFGRRLGPHRWPELETTARPGEESSGGGGAGWGSRRCGSGQPAVPAGGISPTESSWCQRAPGPEVVPLHSYPRRGDLSN